MNLTEIKDPSFIKKLSIKELNELAEEIRNFIIDTTSINGGHVASNLGVVELTLAAHYVFDFSKDKILFDVSHQCYTHKILTGRANEMKKLRKIDGASGFSNPSESKYDVMYAGHSATSLPTALGLAISRDTNKEDFNIVTIIGDASISSGLSLETLNQIGYLKKKMIIILNDNEMSINKNVGALAKSMSEFRTSNFYQETKKTFKKTVTARSLYNLLESLKNSVKYTFIKPGIFRDFNLEYYGPIDGHDIKALINVFNAAKNDNEPVIIHCVTTKGKGYKYAEDDNSGKWHGIAPYNIETGELVKKKDETQISYSQLVSNSIEKLMDEDKNMICITPAMIYGSSLTNIFKKYPDRSIDCGIAEDEAINVASGILLNNNKVFVSIYSSFLQRAYDQLNHDISRMNLPIILGIDRAGLVGEDGSGHNGVFDISLINSLPNFVLAEGKDYNEIINLINLAFKSNKPFALRYPRGNTEVQNFQKNEIILGKWEKICNKLNDKAIIITYGEDVIKLQNLIESRNLPYTLVNARFIKPIDEEMLHELYKSNLPIYIYTTDMIKGGLIDSILEFKNKYNYSSITKYTGINEQFIKHGELDKIKEEYHLDINYFIDNISKDI